MPELLFTCRMDTIVPPPTAEPILIASLGDETKEYAAGVCEDEAVPMDCTSMGFELDIREISTTDLALALTDGDGVDFTDDDTIADTNIFFGDLGLMFVNESGDKPSSEVEVSLAIAVLVLETTGILARVNEDLGI